MEEVWAEQFDGFFMYDILPPHKLLSAHCTPNTSSAGCAAWMPPVSRATSPGVEGGKQWMD